VATSFSVNRRNGFFIPYDNEGGRVGPQRMVHPVFLRFTPGARPINAKDVSAFQLSSRPPHTISALSSI
jgi:hypothetical protein